MNEIIRTSTIFTAGKMVDAHIIPSTVVHKYNACLRTVKCPFEKKGILRPATH